VESDSSDRTLEELQKLKAEIPNFAFVSLGNITEIFPQRTQRIAHCRNYFLEQIKSNNIYSGVDYVVVADLDNLNTRIDRSAVESCWSRQDWEMCAANQNGPYYDIWALRHREWCPGDCWAQYHFMNKHSLNFEKNLMTSVFSKMIRISQDSEWLEVDSAFGGFAIYRKSAFVLGEYSGTNLYGGECCEHVPFNAKLKEHGARLFINPRLINADLTEHTRRSRFWKRARRKIKFTVKRFLSGANRIASR
jgi:glycosyltransferase involved in cell wall biosynthesis